MTPDRADPVNGLRVLGFCDYFGGTSSGGAERVAAEVYRRLADRGAQVKVVSVVPGGNDETTLVAGVDTRVVPGVDLTRRIGVQLTVSPRLVGIARRVAVDFEPDVLHASSLHFAGSAAAALLARSSRLPLAATAHIGSPAALPGLTRAAIRAYESTVGRFILGTSRQVIAVSQSVASHLRRLGTPARKIAVVPNGVDHGRFAPSPRAGTPHVVFVGRLIGNKGPADALAAFAAAGYPGARLTFVGAGPMRESLEHAARRIDQEGIRFAGHVDDVAGILATADVLIRPSQTEGQSLAVLEAMAAGVCVLASDIPANRELLGKGRYGVLAAAGDRVDLAVRLRSLLEDEASRERIGAAGRKRAAEYTWDACAARTGEVLSETAGRG